MASVFVGKKVFRDTTFRCSEKTFPAKCAMIVLVKFSLHNRQRRVKAPWTRIAERGARAAEYVAAKHLEAFANIGEIEVSVLNDAEISRIHADFLGDPTPTDVITFHHGEILLGAETIASNAAHYGETLERELLRCIIHGCLHLAGFLDASPEDFQRMKTEEEVTLRVIMN